MIIIYKESKFWDRLSTIYDKNSINKYAQAYADTIAKTRKYLKTSNTVLDYGCGTGITTIELSKDVKKMHAIDYSAKMIQVAKMKSIDHKICNIDFLVGTLDEKSIEAEPYDVVMAFNILCYIKEDDKVIQRIYELLKPGGVFVSTTDCRGDKMILMNILMSLCSKLRLIPFMRFYKIGDLEENIKRNGFKILETQNLHHGMPNYFIAAMK